MNQAEKTFLIVIIFGTSVFFYYFFVLPPTPVYHNNSMNPLPRNAKYDPEKDDWVTGYEYPSAILVTPAILVFYTLMMIITDNGEKRLREIINVKKSIRNLKISCILKVREGIEEYKEWKNK